MDFWLHFLSSRREMVNLSFFLNFFQLLKINNNVVSFEFFIKIMHPKLCKLYEPLAGLEFQLCKPPKPCNPLISDLIFSRLSRGYENLSQLC